MSQPGPPRKRRRRRSSGAPKRVDFWGEQAALGEPRRIVPANDPTALLRSLGAPPLQRHATVGEVYLESVVKRAAGVAVALASTAGVLADGSED